MSLEDRKRKELQQLHPLDHIFNPQKILQMRAQMEQQQKKELFTLKQQVERTKIMQDPALRKEKAGTGGLKLYEVDTADAKPSIRKEHDREKAKARTEKQLGRTEQSRKSA